MSNERKPDWQWRPATEADVGRLVRFGDCPFCYGLLVEIGIYSKSCLQFECEYGDGTTDSFIDCEVQYDANEEPL